MKERTLLEHIHPHRPQLFLLKAASEQRTLSVRLQSWLVSSVSSYGVFDLSDLCPAA